MWLHALKESRSPLSRRDQNRHEWGTIRERIERPSVLVDIVVGTVEFRSVQPLVLVLERSLEKRGGHQSQVFSRNLIGTAIRETDAIFRLSP
jgi:hypothetical protein